MNPEEENLINVNNEPPPGETKDWKELTAFDPNAFDLTYAKPMSAYREKVDEQFDKEEEDQIQRFKKADFLASRMNSQMKDYKPDVTMFSGQEEFDLYKTWKSGGSIKPKITLEEDIEDKAQVFDLDLDANKTNLYYNQRDNNTFVRNYYNVEKLAGMGVAANDFQGWLNKNGFAEDFEQDIKEGVFVKKTGGGRAAMNPMVLFGGSESQEDLDVAKERVLDRYLAAYKNDVNEKINLKSFYNDYNSNKDKYSNFKDFDSSYNYYKSQNQLVTTFDENKYESYQDSEFQKMTNRDKKIIKDQIEFSKDRSSQSTAESSLRGLGEIVYESGAGFFEALDDTSNWLADVVGLDNLAEQRRYIKMERQMADPKKNLQYLRVSGKSIKMPNGKTYLKDENGTLYDTDNNLSVGMTLSAKEQERISKLIDVNGVEDSDYSARGFANVGGNTVGNIMFQVLGTKGIGGARLATSKAYLAATNRLSTVSRFKKYSNLASKSGFKNVKLKLPFDKRMIDASAFQTLYGAQSGYENTIIEAKKAGLTDVDAEKLANRAQVEMAALYGITGPINPRLPMLNKLDNWLASSGTINKAIKAYKQTGSKKAFSKSVGESVKKLLPNQKSVTTFVSEGFKETAQENIQQVGESFLVNRDINTQAGFDLLKADYSVDDFISTSILSFATAGLLSAGKIPSFKQNANSRLTNLYEISKDVDKSKKLLDFAVKRGRATQSQADDIIKQAEAVRQGANKVPAFMLQSPDAFIEHVTKQQEIRDLVKSKEAVDKSFHPEKDKDIERLEGELQEIATRTAQPMVQKEVDVVERIVGKENIKTFETTEEFKAAGFEGEDKTDGLLERDGVIYINKQRAAEAGSISVASHELLHKVLGSEFKNNKQINKVVNEFKDILDKKGVLDIIEDRADIYRAENIDIDGKDADEYFTIFSDAIAKNEIDFNVLEEPQWKTIGRRILDLFRTKFGFKNAEFTTGQQVFDFIRDYQKNIKKGKLTTQAKKKLADYTPDQLGTSKKSLSLLENINNLVPSNVNTKEEFQSREVFNPIFNATQPGGAIYNYVNSRALSKEEAEITLEGVIDRLINFDPAAIRKTTSGDPITFGEFIFANTRFSKLDAKKRLAIESERRAESLDTEEARQVAEPVAETTTTEAPRVEYKNLVESKVLPTEIVAKVDNKILLITKTLKSRIDAATSINKTVTPLMSEIKKEIGKQADIEFKKMLGAKRGGELKNNFLKLKKPILENMTTTWLMQGMPFAVQKSVDGKFTSDWEGKKIDRESVGTDKAGRTSGAQLARRLPNAANKITDEQFLTYMFKGDEVIRGRKEALAKALAEEYAFDIYSKELQDPSSEIRKAFENNQQRLGVQLADNTIQEFNKQAERGNIKRSISNLTDKQLSVWNSNALEFFAGLKTIIPGNFTLKSISALHKQVYSTEDIPAKLQASISKQFFNVLKSIKSEEQLRQLEIEEGSFESYLEAIAKDMDANETITAMTNAPQSVPASYSDFNNVLEATEVLEDVISDLDIQEAVAFMGGTFANSGRVGRWVEGKYDANITHRSDLYAGQEEVIKALNRAGFNIKSISNKDITLNNGKVIKRELSATGNVNKSHITGKHDLQADKKNADAAWNFTTAIIKGIKNAIPTVQQMIMASLNSGTNTSLRAAAPVLYVSNILPSKLTKDYRYEHGVPARVVLAHMYSSIVNGNKDIDMKALKQDYSVAIIPVEMDKVIGESGYQKVMFAGYVPGKRPWHNRYYNFITRGKIQYALKSFKDGSVIGQKYADYYNNAKKRSLSNFNIDESNKIKTQQKALNNARKMSYTENPKGISVYDFDDTLAFSKSQIIVKKDGKTFKINAAQFAKQGETLLAEGAKFDFSEFNKVVKGQPGPLIPRIQKAIDKFGNNNIFILTARPVASESAIHAFMKGLGIDIPRANITGLANSTAQAKADWMVGKVAEGFNDFYFVDDAIKNVKAVRDVLENFDVNSKVQQAIANRKRSMSSDLNEMIERNKGVRAETTYSKVLARKKGAKKGKFKLFVPYSAEDFKGLTSYTLAGKGKQGEADQKLFDETLILPYTRGIAAMEGATQALKNDYKSLLNMFGLKKELPKKIGDTDFTTDQAVRVYLWDQQGFDIPNISKRDQNKLSSLVSKDPDLVGFAEGLMAVSKKDNWINPKEHWDVGSILKDLNDITDNVNRKEYLAEFIENVDEMFNQTNLNKLEAIYGTNYIDALQNSIRRMKSGSNSPRSAGKIEQKWLNWVNNSVGTIMFFNRRSALLQMLSFTNFINWSDNNPAKAAAAFANQPLYWKNWVKIFNSDKLKERRGGLKSDIQESEIANQAKNSKDKAAAVVSYLLKIGFTPTQIADSFAIATGGSTFLINRTKKYEKQGLSKKEAEAKAFEDFGRISDETQQSGDPMLISQQQSSHLGRLILAFQNTPMQYVRLMKKAGKDIINRRGSDVENLSKIAYYGFVQNLIFSSLQSALFALIPGFDDEEEDDAKLEDKAIRTANSMVDTILRGTGIVGAVIATLKNAIMRYKKEDEKGFTADQTYTMLELANLSPPIGSKLRKVYSAMQTRKFNKDVIDYMGMHVKLDGKLNPSPNYEIIANISSAVANIPADRLLSEIKSINEAFDSRNTSYQRAALALGWRTWDVNVKNEEQDLIKTYFKQQRKELGKKKAAEKRKAKKQEEINRLKAMTPEQLKQYKIDKYKKRKEAAETRRKNKFGG